MNLPFVQNIQGIKGTNGLIKCNNFQLLTIAFLVEIAYLSRAVLCFFPSCSVWVIRSFRRKSYVGVSEHAQ